MSRGGAWQTPRPAAPGARAAIDSPFAAAGAMFALTVACSPFARAAAGALFACAAPGARRAARSSALVAAALAVFLAVAPPLRAAGEPGERAEIERHLAAAQEAFRRGIELDTHDSEAAREHYLRAVMHFERIAEAGVRNGKLFYNIGNTWFLLGDLGRAILNYRRAALYTPSDPNLEENLRYARSRRLDRIEPQQRERVFKTLFFFHYDLPARARFAAFLACFVALWCFASAAALARRRWLRTAVAVTAAISAVLLASLLVERAAAARRPPGVILAAEVVARKGNAETFQPSFTEPLHAGTEFKLVEQRADWWYIELDDGARCWIPAASGELVVP